MNNSTILRAALLGSASLGLCAPAMAQGVGQRSDPVIVVTATGVGTPTAPSIEQARERLEQVPGGVGLVEDSVFAEDFAQSIGDVLTLTPGVFADTSAQRESRISIRGSGLNSGFERRGITVLRETVAARNSSGGKFVSIRLSFHAEDRARYEAAHAALRAEPSIKWTL